MFAAHLTAEAARTLEAARARSAMIVTVESCTGGLVGALLTAIPGSSDAVDGGFITYSNDAKARLGVPADLIAAHGAVSEPVARAMAEAAARAVDGMYATVSITGVAGPGGGTAEKPVGLVHFAARFAGVTHHCCKEFGDLGRDEIREASALEAFALIRRALEQ